MLFKLNKRDGPNLSPSGIIDYKWYGLRVHVSKSSTVKKNILQIDHKYIKYVYNINDFLKKYHIRKGILFINMYMCSKLKYTINNIDGTYGFLLNNRNPCVISDFDVFLADINRKVEEEQRKLHEEESIELAQEVVDSTKHDIDMSAYQPGSKVIITFGIFKDSIGYVNSVNYSNHSVVVKVILEDSDLTITTDISIFYVKII